ncbi:LacI family DNA-binding transcriptional regulator [Jiangella gansuensis]|uniref:LacI family DNA-binding transcriptional regulator n=1 Tax=Jiangella gansuensis TaxID=281473 RepID=UPI00146FA290|nr:LacI family DNA-binding transcriptional regulator [Jiangella gansuensis]
MTVQRRRHASIIDVAALAGVSVTTVSHTLSQRRPVSAATRERVLDAIAELGYQPNDLARSMRSQRTNTIALVIPDITNPFYTSVARGLQDAIQADTYFGIVCNTDANPDLERKTVEQLVKRRVDGIVFSGYYQHQEDIRPAVSVGIPVVLLGSHRPKEGYDVVNGADHESGAEATRYLIGRGHRRIGFITAPAGSGAPAVRVDGYRAALHEAGIPAEPDLLLRAPVSGDGGAQGMNALLDLPEPPDAVIATNDVVAIGAIGAAHARGLRIPDDIAVMGFDDIEAARLITPKLTTMANQSHQIGHAAGRLVLQRIAGEGPPDPQEVVFSAQLRRRESA